MPTLEDDLNQFADAFERAQAEINAVVRKAAELLADDLEVLKTTIADLAQACSIIGPLEQYDGISPDALDSITVPCPQCQEQISLRDTVNGVLTCWRCGYQPPRTTYSAIVD